MLDSAALLLIYGVVGAVALAFAWPWLARPSPGGQTLARYVPIRNGAATLTAKYDPTGAVQAWESQNVAVVPPQASSVELRPALAFAIANLHKPPEESALDVQATMRRLAGLHLVQTQSRTLETSGRVVTETVVSVREPRGDLLVGYHVPASDTDIVFDPPALVLPSTLVPGGVWESQGRLGQSGTYAIRGVVLDAGPYTGGRDVEDCLQVRVDVSISAGGGPANDTAREAWYCAGVGEVESQSFDAQGGLTSRDVVIAGDGVAVDLQALPPAQRLSVDAGELPDTGAWRMSRLGRARRLDYPASSTIAPVWVPTDPPMLLVAGSGGDLVAFDASNDDGTILWQFHPAGTIYGRPVFDPTRGRIYFGASDKRLYALDTRGLFVWSFETGDSVASRPVVAGDTVVFGSEDRDVYGLDADTGALRWREKTGGAVVSSPVLVDDVEADPGEALVVIGSDDGGAYGLDPATGERRWLYTAARAIEAPIVYADGAVYVASRDGSLASVDAHTGEASWSTNVNDAVDVIRGALRTAPALSPERAFVVDDWGNLTALDRRDGRRVWSIRERAYVGPPVVIGEELLVGRKDGGVDRLGLDGDRHGDWTPADATSPIDPTPKVILGPAAGGGALWLADDGAVVRRLGAPEGTAAGSTPLRLAWFHQTSSPAVAASPITLTAAEYRGAGVLVDNARSIFLVEPVTGRIRRQGRLAGEGFPALTDPVVVGDTLLAVFNGTLQAARLPEGTPAWEFKGTGTTPHRITAAGDRALWITQQADTESGAPKRDVLYALDLADGAPRWQATLGDSLLAAGAVVRDDRVFTSAPPAAFDLATGEPGWRAELTGQTYGGPALSASGDTLFVGVAHSVAQGELVALDTADGRMRWRAELGTDILNWLERPWISGESVVVPAISGRLIALDVATGAERWRYEPSPARASGITVDAGRVWLWLENGRVLALDAQTGKPAARFSALDLNLVRAVVAQRPAVIGGAIIVPPGLVILGFEEPR